MPPDHLNRADHLSDGKHTLHLLTESLGWHSRYLLSGSVRVREENYILASMPRPAVRRGKRPGGATSTLLRQVSCDGDVPRRIAGGARNHDLAVRLDCYCGNKRHVSTAKAMCNTPSGAEGAVQLSSA